MSHLPSNKSRHHQPIEQKASQDQRENGAVTTLERSGSKIQSAFVEAITYRKPSNESFKMDAKSQSYALEPSDLLRQDSHSSKLRQKTALELTWEKKVVQSVKYSIKVNVWRCFSSKGFDHIVCFKQNLDAELMCDISKRGLFPTAQKQFDHNSTLWKLQSEKHASKLAPVWKRNNGVHEIH